MCRKLEESGRLKRDKSFGIIRNIPIEDKLRLNPPTPSVTMDFSREIHLKNQFNDFWSKIFEEQKDYFSQISGNDLHVLKAALSNINNIITYNTTIRFIEYISQRLNIDETEKTIMLSFVKSCKPNANGFDIEYTGEINIIAEIKCNRPINGENRFGSAQKDSITKDIQSLFNGKSKSSLAQAQITDYYKFMVFYRFDYKTDEAVENYIKNLPPDLSNHVVFANSMTVFPKDKVLIVLIDG